MFSRRKLKNVWDGMIEPFKIIGNVYFVGTYQASSHIIDTGDGLIMIDTGYEKTLYLVIKSIYELGFKLKDIKYIINTHWHIDHAEGTAAIAALSGAKTIIGRHDLEKARQFFDADITVKDGDTLTLGNTTISFMETPGHTKGTISLFFYTSDGEKTYRVGTFGGAGANTLVEGKFDYENCRKDYVASIHRLKAEKVDVFIGNHTWNNDTERKGEILRTTGENQFINSNLWVDFLNHREKKFYEMLEKEEIDKTKRS